MTINQDGVKLGGSSDDFKAAFTLQRFCLFLLKMFLNVFETSGVYTYSVFETFLDTAQLLHVTKP